MRAGATGFVSKEAAVSEIADAARLVAEGHSFVSPEMAGRLLVEFAAMSRRLAEMGSRSGEAPALTDREVQILQTMAEGVGNAHIAELTGLTEHAVRNHVRNILEKLHLFSRAEAVLYAVRTRLVDP